MAGVVEVVAYGFMRVSLECRTLQGWDGAGNTVDEVDHQRCSKAGLPDAENIHPDAFQYAKSSCELEQAWAYRVLMFRV